MKKNGKFDDSFGGGGVKEKISSCYLPVGDRYIKILINTGSQQKYLL